VNKTILSALIAIGVVLPLSGAVFAQSPPIFAPPQNLGPKINTSFYEADPFWDGPRKRLYFVSTRDGAEDIWYSQWTDTGWTNATKLGPQINGSPRFDHSPSVSPDGQRFYYTVGNFSWDIWVATWNSSLNDWNNPAALPFPVNTSGEEFSAHIAPDGVHLYFYSLTTGRCGFYVSEWNGSNWSNPVEVAPNLGLCGLGAQYPSITADGQWLYFDGYVSDGKSLFVSAWNGVSWGLALDLRPQIGGRSSTPSILPSGDSLFFASGDIGGFGMRDIWMARRLGPKKVSALRSEGLLLLALFLTWGAIFWIRKLKSLELVGLVKTRKEG
jgi:Tol biopolymer transport system component